MARAKTIHILIIGINVEWFSFLFSQCFLKERKLFLRVSIEVKKHSWKFYLEKAVDNAASLILANFLSCFGKLIQTRKMFSISPRFLRGNRKRERYCLTVLVHTKGNLKKKPTILGIFRWKISSKFRFPGQRTLWEGVL